MSNMVGCTSSTRDEEEFEEFLCFMFGNVDNSGHLDVDYLDEHAKEHLAAVADKLGPCLTVTDIDLFAKSPQILPHAAEQDYDVKAVDAVDYEDINELYEGPEIQAASEEDYLLPKNEYFSSKLSVAIWESKGSVLDDENYDEDTEIAEEHAMSDQNFEDQTVSLAGEQGGCLAAFPGGENSPKDDLQLSSLEAENLAVDLDHFLEIQQEVDDVLKGPLDGKGSTPLPILCIEDGMVILRFSEIFGILNPLKKKEKIDHRYSLHRERCKVMDDCRIEEDEEAFLKGTGQVFSYVKKLRVIQHGISVFKDDESVSVKWGSAHDNEHRKDSCLSAEPMKEDVTVNLSMGWHSPLCPKFYPLDQQDWEDRIIWDYSPAVSDNSVESCEICAPELEALVNKDAGPPDEKAHNFFLHSSPVFLEAFGSRISLGPTGFSFSDSRCHPQLLRLDSLVEVDNCNDADGRRENIAVNHCRGDTMRQFNKLSLQNRDMLEGSWLNNIIWEPHEAKAKPKLILDLQDEHMLFEIKDNKDGEIFWLHAGAMIITRSVKPPNGDSFDLPDHGYQSSWRFNIATDNNLNSNKHTSQSKVLHSAPTPMPSAMMKKRTAAGQGISTVTGIDADLRRLSMEAARKPQLQSRGKCQEIWDPHVVDGDKNESDSKANSDLDSFAGDLETLLDAEEYEQEVHNYESKHDKADGVKRLLMRRHPSQAQADREIEDEAAECRFLMEVLSRMKPLESIVPFPAMESIVPFPASVSTVSASLMSKTDSDDEAEQKKKRKFLEDEVGLAPCSQPIFGFEIAKLVKRIPSTAQSSGFYASKKKMTDPKENYKEIKSSRENYSCRACGQLGHMKTNKKCPKYKEYQEARLQIRASMNTQNVISEGSFQQTARGLAKAATNMEKVSEKSNCLDLIKAPEGKKFSSKVKVLSLNFKCGSTNTLSDELALGATQCSDQLFTSDAETGKKSVVYVTSKIKPEVAEVGSHKPTIMMRPPRDPDQFQMDSHKPLVAIQPPSTVIPLSTHIGRERPSKKIIIKFPKEIIDLDQANQDGTTGHENRESKEAVEMCNSEKHGQHEGLRSTKESAKRKDREERRWWEEEEKRRNAKRQQEERARRLCNEEMRVLEERRRSTEVKRHEEAIRRWRKEERHEVKKKNRVKKQDELEDYRARRYDRRMPERDQNAERKPFIESGRYGTEYFPPTKRHKRGEVGLANILECIVETLKARYNLSYLFLKPVSKKEAPDYLDSIKHPMDLSTIREKVRRLEYKHRKFFRHDVWQIAFNAHTYNDRRNPGIPPLADKLLEFCDYLLEQNHESLSEAEWGIDF